MAISSPEDKLAYAAASAPARMSSAPRLWDVFKAEISSCGLVLFDLDLPTSRHGILRVFITRPKDQEDSASGHAEPATTSSSEATLGDENAERSIRSGGVTLEDCTRVSKHLSTFMESEQGRQLGLASSDWDLEVSSPGINRVLKRPEHYAEALGERVAIKFSTRDVEIALVKTDAAASPQGGLPQTSSARRKAERLVAKATREMDRVRERKTISGTLAEYDGSTLLIVTDDGAIQARIPLSAVTHARIDFLFVNR